MYGWTYALRSQCNNIARRKIVRYTSGQTRRNSRDQEYTGKHDVRQMRNLSSFELGIGTKHNNEVFRLRDVKQDNAEAQEHEILEIEGEAGNASTSKDFADILVLLSSASNTSKARGVVWQLSHVSLGH